MPRQLLGTPPLPLPLLLLAKGALGLCWLFPAAGLAGLGDAGSPPSLLIWAGGALFALGLLMVLLAILHLGESLAVGLPETPAGLRTRGLYRFSRNPIYLGAFFMCGGSVLAVPHPLNAAFFLVALVLHHRIVRREEVYLADAYGDAWREYSARVPRWI